MGNIYNKSSLIAGRAKTVVFQVVDARGEPVNMANSKVYYTGKTSKDVADGSATITVKETQPDNAETQDGWISYTIPADQVPLDLVSDGDVQLVYGEDYKMTSTSDAINIREGKQSVVKGVLNDPQW